jgi:hypothetical protein
MPLHGIIAINAGNGTIEPRAPLDEYLRFLSCATKAGTEEVSRIPP